MADIAHHEGNAAYTRGDLESAEKAYAIAAKLDGSDAKYTSNLSAVYYEQGRYPNALESIYNSWRALRERYKVDETPSTPPLTEPLAPKLALRFMKSKLNGVAARQLSFHGKAPKKRTPESNFGIELDVASFVDSLLKSEGGEKHGELARVWPALAAMKEECSRHSVEECKAGVTEAEKRYRTLPVFKSSLDPILEYYRFGHDPIRSLYYGVDGNPDNEHNIEAKDAIKEKWKSVSFLFGGCGDARHAFATFIHHVELWKQLVRKHNVADEKLPKLHMTLLDIHPAALTRVMLVFTLIRKGSAHEDINKHVETYAAAFYVWSTILMPRWASEIVSETAAEMIEELTGKTPKRWMKIIAVDDTSLARILPVLEYWSKPLPKTMEAFMEVNGSYSGDIVGALGGLMGVKAPQASSLARNKAFQKAKRELKAMSKPVPGIDSENPLYNNCAAEEKLYNEMKILLPPTEFLDRHPMLRKYGKSQDRQSKEDLKKEIMKDWVPNATLFDDWTTEHPAFATPGGIPILHTANPFPLANDIMHWIVPFRDAGTLLVQETTWVVVSMFFDSVSRAMSMMYDDVTIEFCCAELCNGLPRLIAGDLGPRPATFPKKYLRMWLSNTPDYTGSVLTNLVYLTPYLETSKFGMIVWNCLLNPIHFTNLKGITYHYSYMNPSDINRFFSVLIRNEQRRPLEEFHMSAIPRVKLFSSTVSKKEVHQYLSALLFRVLCPPTAPTMPPRLDEPINFVTFFGLLVYLCQKASCPSHWVGDFVQSLVNDTFSTDAVAFTGMLPMTEAKKPRPLAAPRKINLEPWQLEMENILVPSQSALPFAVTLPGRYSTSYEAIKLYRAPVRSTVNRLETPHNTRTAVLIFYRASDAARGDLVASTLPSRVTDLIEGRDSALAGMEVQMLTSPEIVDLHKGYVMWKMSQGRFDRMKKEEWKVMVYITNQARIGSNSVEARLWKACGEVGML
ncbi:hypothetical protein BKA70DRAFT_1307700 [Coprinopsis sp. MPI-PUGE-AT-0042]|nr:hypothetical protein BKA70DRAFT_1307700 [Coprinopsis sp. MPI-PUGE-AT-0042]